MKEATTTPAEALRNVRLNPAVVPQLAAALAALDTAGMALEREHGKGSAEAELVLSLFDAVGRVHGPGAVTGR